MRWRLLIEEYGPELIYIPGNTNLVADCLSRHEVDDHKLDGSHENFALDKSDLNAYPLSYKLIMKYQQNDKGLLKIYATTKHTY